MSYSFRLYESIREVPLEDWDLLRRHRPDVFMDPRFVAAVERSMSDAARFWCLLVHDAARRPVASACLSLFQLDLALLGQPTLRRIADWARRVFPGFLKLPVLFCGLPVSAGQSHLCLAPQSDWRQSLATIDEALCRLARRHRAVLVVFKEFSEEDRDPLDHLLSLGYVRGESLPMNHFAPQVGSFEEFCASLRSHYRYKIRRSRRKFEQAGYRVEHWSARDALDHYSDEVHELYRSVVDRAEVKLEYLPRAFFEELARQFPDEIRFTAVRKEGRIVGFAWGLSASMRHQNLFIGLDYRLNAEADLYFNLMAEDLACAIGEGARDVQVGQTADVFKSRMACYPRPRYVYVRGTGAIVGWLVRGAAGWCFPPPAPPPRRDLFRVPSPGKRISRGTGPRLSAAYRRTAWPH